MNTPPFLIGNSFPLSLVRRRAEIEPRPLDELRESLRTRPWHSFWGHSNTIQAANALLGVDVSPASERPAITLSEERLPSLEGTTVRECWILSPDYRPGFRPPPNIEVAPEKILGWQVVRITWK
jgi:hypothetical protein